MSDENTNVILPAVEPKRRGRPVGSKNRNKPINSIEEGRRALKYNSTNDSLMVMAAVRYCLGRQSYIVSACQEWLRQNWSEFAAENQSIIVRDIVEKLQDDETGGAGDTASWLYFVKWAYPQMAKAKREWVKYNVEWRKKPWPLDEKPCSKCGKDWLDCECRKGFKEIKPSPDDFGPSVC
jgi:hypothetical protein